MKNTHSGKAAKLKEKCRYLNRIVTLTNRIYRNQLRCARGNEENGKRIRCIEQDIEFIAREVARQATHGNSNS